LELEAEARQPGSFQGLSVADTIAKCIIFGNSKVRSVRDPYGSSV
jgi:hypothetical protein